MAHLEIHDHDLFALPKHHDCETCDVSRKKERSAKRNKGNQLDARIKATRFAEHVCTDTLFLKEGSDGKLLSHSTETKLKLQVFRDEKTGDIAVYPVPNRKTKTMRNVMIEFGGHRSAIITMTSDRAPELVAVGSSLGIAVFKSTLGRSISNSKAERSNETCLEWGRHDFERGRQGITWGAHAIEHALMHRRCQEVNGKTSIYEAKHGPNVKKPELYQHMARVFFKLSEDQQHAAKISSPGRVGVLVGYCPQPGGAWSGDCKVADLRDFEEGSGRTKARILIMKAISFPNGRPTFPIAEAQVAAKKERIVQRIRQSYDNDVEPGEEETDDESEDEETKQFFQEQADAQQGEANQQEEDERREARVVGTGLGGQNAPLPKEIPKHLLEHFRLGGW